VVVVVGVDVVVVRRRRTTPMPPSFSFVAVTAVSGLAAPARRLVIAIIECSERDKREPMRKPPWLFPREAKERELIDQLVMRSFRIRFHFFVIFSFSLKTIFSKRWHRNIRSTYQPHTPHR